MTYIKVTEALARGAQALRTRAIYTGARIIATDPGSLENLADRHYAQDDREAAVVLAQLAADPRLIDATLADLANNPQLLKQAKP